MKETEMQFKYFACVVDGEYAGTLGVAYSMPALIAGMESNPTIIPINEEQQKTLHLGMVWNGTEFVPGLEDWEQ
jgi:hypothetical protein